MDEGTRYWAGWVNVAGGPNGLPVAEGSGLMLPDASLPLLATQAAQERSAAEHAERTAEEAAENRALVARMGGAPEMSISEYLTRVNRSTGGTRTDAEVIHAERTKGNLAPMRAEPTTLCEQTEERMRISR